MNIIGEDIAVVHATDPTKVGLRGKVVLETAKTILVESDRGRLRVEKKGAGFMLASSNQVVSGDLIMGRLEDRLRSGRS